MRRPTSLLLILSIAIPLLTYSCSDPQTISIEPWSVLLSNLESAWNNMDISLLEQCFRDDFQHYLLPVDWDDYNGDGIIDQYWGLEMELAFAEGTFNQADSIYFVLSGGSSQQWAGDSTGSSMQLDRTYQLKVFTDESQTPEYETSGEISFICRPDSQGDWYIWLWYDVSKNP